MQFAGNRVDAVIGCRADGERGDGSGVKLCVARVADDGVWEAVALGLVASSNSVTSPSAWSTTFFWPSPFHSRCAPPAASS